MNLFVDTSVWSLALRRDRPQERPEVERLARALEDGEGVFTTGLVLQELPPSCETPAAAGASRSAPSTRCSPSSACATAS